MNPTIHCHTPTLAAVDARRLPVRTIAYHRTLANDTPQARVNRQAYDSMGRLVEQWDPRLWALVEARATVPANQTSVYSLSGQVLASTSVDAGWRVNLPAESGQSLRRWDNRGSESRFEYEHDALLRPVAVFEHAPGEIERCVERLRYAGPEAAVHNLCGQMIRHDDTAGSLMVHDAGLNGGILQQSRRFLSLETTPNWPLEEPQCDALLEPGAGAVTHQRYSALGESLTHTDAKGHRQRFAYTVAGQLHSTWLQLAGEAEQILVSAMVYNAFGQAETETAGNGVVTIARYSSLDGRLEQLLARKANGTRLQDLTYDYDPAGNILSIRDAAQPVRHFNNQRIEPVSTYRYDTLYQLIEATGRESAMVAQGPDLSGLQDPNQLANYTQNYSYDEGGNLTTLHHVGAQCYTREMQVEAHSNRSVPKDEIDLAVAFDPNGNLQELQPGQDLSWDLRNQLRQVTPVERVEAANDDEVYVYDGGGQRVRKVRHCQARSVMHRAEVRYLPGVELRTNTATGETLQVISVSAGRSGVRVLHWESGQGLPEGMVNDQLRYSLSDHLGSSSVELDEQARLISQEGYYPYAGTAWWAGRNSTEAKYKTIRYSGKERDATGLYYYGFRYYAPWLNRWINPDPAGDTDGLNLYRMVRNNPISFLDPDGRNPTPLDIKMVYFEMLERGKAWHGSGFSQQLDGYKAFADRAALNMPDFRAPGTITLDLDETIFKLGMTNESFHLVHFSSKDIQSTDKGVPSGVTFMSRNELGLSGVDFNKDNTAPEDIKKFATTDFAFFSVGLGSASQKPSSRFGYHRYSIPLEEMDTTEHGQYAMLQMNDVLNPWARPVGLSPQKIDDVLGGHLDDVRSFNSPIASNEDPRFSAVAADMVFLAKDMPEAIANRIIFDMHAQPYSPEAKARVYSVSSSEDRDRVVNTFYRPQYLVPIKASLKPSQYTYKNTQP
ncbi:hypothetical protein NYP20_14890 [Pseudomonas sp. N3-W]|uniref:RHS repeat-associated core domain-containing protein n=1 Tax=Pseudomonas sp. N3-W TaxID=2975049 RepID=UPI00217E7FEB|nr:RHS repeat-associated core domain-containing protein [Pseudomonas sp. N3-W]UWF52173.1 hypothetical protein NYP20_14890 [Pseudomonas sp. N3-W]